ncbi:hypothetical protein BCR34DRAFT_584038 [Clohesyomyces aquaticus]|uniref:Uncharacterized protein n=1 Tax=Clohesyomyces aquaticus TaxID=1231657 RepID=A0A1Y2A387_9PLEO|nr:hypothetical protein BCR34DRAFT_584038 [Clohesyomyces aquaticus]
MASAGTRKSYIGGFDSKSKSPVSINESELNQSSFVRSSQGSSSGSNTSIKGYQGDLVIEDLDDATLAARNTVIDEDYNDEEEDGEEEEDEDGEEEEEESTPIVPAHSEVGGKTLANLEAVLGPIPDYLSRSTSSNRDENVADTSTSKEPAATTTTRSLKKEKKPTASNTSAVPAPAPAPAAVAAPTNTAPAPANTAPAPAPATAAAPAPASATASTAAPTAPPNHYQHKERQGANLAECFALGREFGLSDATMKAAGTAGLRHHLGQLQQDFKNALDDKTRQQIAPGWTPPIPAAPVPMGAKKAAKNSGKASAASSEGKKRSAVQADEGQVGSAGSAKKRKTESSSISDHAATGECGGDANEEESAAKNELKVYLRLITVTAQNEAKAEDHIMEGMRPEDAPIVSQLVRRQIIVDKESRPVFSVEGQLCVGDMERCRAKGDRKLYDRTWKKLRNRVVEFLKDRGGVSGNGKAEADAVMLEVFGALLSD